MTQYAVEDAVICCPNRLYDGNYKVLSEIAAEVFGAGSELVRGSDVPARRAAGGMTGNEVAVFGRYWGQELPLRRSL